MTSKIIEKISKERKLPPEQVKMVIDSLYDGLRYYLTNPLETKDGIILHNFLSFYIDEKKVNKYVERLKLKQFKNPPRSEESQLEFYDDLLKVKKKYERQKKQPVFNQQFGTRTPQE